MMGMSGSESQEKSAAAPASATTSSGGSGAGGLRQQYEKVQNDLDEQYAKSRVFTHTARGMGLGFGSL